jgi:putative acetyltransferase
VRIRAETERDWAEIAAVTEAAFGKLREARMIELIRASDGFGPELSLVAEDDRLIVGHILMSYVELEGVSTRLLEIGPVSVRPERQRSGIGSRLVRESLRLADARNEPLVLVLGHPTYYPRFGFRRASEFGITPPNPEIPDAAVMIMPLQAYDPTLRGRVVFPPSYETD